ncbi:MAG: dicarboxylate/amino acid:cation symporter [Thalassotalea sp.]
MKLIIKLVVGIVFGTLIGLFAPEFVVRLLLTLQSLFGQLIKFTIPLIILFYIASGIASLPQGSNRLLTKTVGFAYGSTILAGGMAYLIGVTLLPLLISHDPLAVSDNSVKLMGYIELNIPPVLEVMSALVLAFILGVGASASQAEVVKKGLNEIRDIVELLLSRVIIPMLPIYIAGVFAKMAMDGSVFSTLQTFAVVLIFAIVLQWLWLMVLYLFTALKVKENPSKLLKNMMPAYFTALGTMSSAATIPVSLKTTKANKVNDDIANFTVPLCASIHLSGSTITIITCALAVILLSPELTIPSLGVMISFILMLGIIMIAAPGAPGGAVMSALGLLGTMLGFNEAALALMIALYLAQDSFGTACNVTGDGAIALLVNTSKR